ncbi:MAG TPA: PEP-utilizing enzyme [Acidimicrobiales bacterium]|nr:PEP-utilizing enzyme [Acidimicrobiales bacterium]
MTATELRWDPPGAGRWDSDPVHWPKPAARLAQAPFVNGTREGLGRAFARHGLPFRTLDMAFVNDVLFQRIVLCDADELERRAPIATHARDVEQWRTDAERWRTTVKPRRLAVNLALQDVDPLELDEASYVKYLRDLTTELQAAIDEHMDLVCIGDVIGRLLLAGEPWGIANADLLALLAGSSPGSTEAAASARAIATMLRGAVVTSLVEARAVSDDVRHAIDAHVRLHGWRMLDSYGPDGTTLAERPELLLRTIVSVLDRPVVDVAALERQIRRRVPPKDRTRFDELLADARDAYGVRDDNEGLTLLWPMGLLRRALLAATRRLGRDAFVLDLDEIESLLLERGGPSIDEVADRVRRREVAAAAIPSTIGVDHEVAPDIPAAILPSLAAAEAAWGAELVAGDAVGIGIGKLPYTGRACVCADAASALDELAPGDVLITSTTTSAFNAVLTIAGALVVEAGGPACHAALVARELGLPAVVGLADATTRFRTGDLVTVDPATGSVVAA